MNIRIQNSLMPYSKECEAIYGHLICALNHSSSGYSFLSGMQRNSFGVSQDDIDTYFFMHIENDCVRVFQRKLGGSGQNLFHNPIIIAYTRGNDADRLWSLREWADSSTYLSCKEGYAQGYREGIIRAKQIVMEMLTE